MKKTMFLPTPLKSAISLSPRLFNKAWRSFSEAVFPVKKSELPRFASITALLFCILFVQNIAKALKDSIITTLVATEVSSILKVWCVLPLAIFISIAYVKLIKHVKTEYIFYGVVAFFISFFLIFAFVLFPSRDANQIRQTLAHLTLQWPHLKWFLVIMKNWDCALLYVIIEMWSNVVFALMFWQFVNSVTSVSESKRFYLLFSLLGQTGIFICGVLLENLTNIASLITNLLNLSSNRTVLCVQIILSIMSAVGFLSMGLFWLLNHVIIDKQLLIKASLVIEPKLKLSDSLRLVMRSRYIRLIGLLLISYGTAISTIESMWREQIKTLYNVPELNMMFTGFVLKFNGIATLFCVLVGSQIIRKFGWKVGATIPLVCTMLSGLMFFTSTNFSAVESSIAALLSIQPAMVALIAGTAQNIVTRSTKCTLFDATKEMLYVPLSPELKTQGKACTEVMGTKLGKSIGSVLQAVIFIMFPSATYHSIGMYLMCVFAITCLVWYYAVSQLSREYDQAIRQL